MHDIAQVNGQYFIHGKNISHSEIKEETEIFHPGEEPVLPLRAGERIHAGFRAVPDLLPGSGERRQTAGGEEIFLVNEKIWIQSRT